MDAPQAAAKLAPPRHRKSKPNDIKIRKPSLFFSVWNAAVIYVDDSGLYYSYINPHLQAKQNICQSRTVDLGKKADFIPFTNIKEVKYIHGITKACFRLSFHKYQGYQSHIDIKALGEIDTIGWAATFYQHLKPTDPAYLNPFISFNSRKILHLAYEMGSVIRFKSSPDLLKRDNNTAVATATTTIENESKNNENNKQTQLKCPGYHQMNWFLTENTHTCDVCCLAIPSNSKMLGCRICNFDACISCTELPFLGKKKRYLPKMACPGNHTRPLGPAWQITPRPGFRCDICYSAIPANVFIYGCRNCNWDSCQACVARIDRVRPDGSLIGADEIVDDHNIGVDSDGFAIGSSTPDGSQVEVGSRINNVLNSLQQRLRQHYRVQASGGSRKKHASSYSSHPQGADGFCFYCPVKTCNFACLEDVDLFRHMFSDLSDDHIAFFQKALKEKEEEEEKIRMEQKRIEEENKKNQQLQQPSSSSLGITGTGGFVSMLSQSLSGGSSTNTTENNTGASATVPMTKQESIERFVLQIINTVASNNDFSALLQKASPQIEQQFQNLLPTATTMEEPTTILSPPPPPPAPVVETTNNIHHSSNNSKIVIVDPAVLKPQLEQEEEDMRSDSFVEVEIVDKPEDEEQVVVVVSELQQQTEETLKENIDEKSKQQHPLVLTLDTLQLMLNVTCPVCNQLFRSSVEDILSRDVPDSFQEHMNKATSFAHTFHRHKRTPIDEDFEQELYEEDTTSVNNDNNNNNNNNTDTTTITTTNNNYNDSGVAIENNSINNNEEKINEVIVDNNVPIVSPPSPTGSIVSVPIDDDTPSSLVHVEVVKSVSFKEEKQEKTPEEEFPMLSLSDDAKSPSSVNKPKEDIPLDDENTDDELKSLNSPPVRKSTSMNGKIKPFTFPKFQNLSASTEAALLVSPSSVGGGEYENNNNIRRGKNHVRSTTALAQAVIANELSLSALDDTTATTTVSETRGRQHVRSHTTSLIQSAISNDLSLSSLDTQEPTRPPPLPNEQQQQQQNRSVHGGQHFHPEILGSSRPRSASSAGVSKNAKDAAGQIHKRGVSHMLAREFANYVNNNSRPSSAAPSPTVSASNTTLLSDFQPGDHVALNAVEEGVISAKNADGTFEVFLVDKFKTMNHVRKVSISGRAGSIGSSALGLNNGHNHSLSVTSSTGGGVFGLSNSTSTASLSTLIPTSSSPKSDATGFFSENSNTAASASLLLDHHKNIKNQKSLLRESQTLVAEIKSEIVLHHGFLCSDNQILQALTNAEAEINSLDSSFTNNPIKDVALKLLTNPDEVFARAPTSIRPKKTRSGNNSSLPAGGILGGVENLNNSGEGGLDEVLLDFWQGGWARRVTPNRPTFDWIFVNALVNSARSSLVEESEQATSSSSAESDYRASPILKTNSFTSVQQSKEETLLIQSMSDESLQKLIKEEGFSSISANTRSELERIGGIAYARKMQRSSNLPRKTILKKAALSVGDTLMGPVPSWCSLSDLARIRALPFSNKAVWFKAALDTRIRGERTHAFSLSRNSKTLLKRVQEQFRSMEVDGGLTSFFRITLEGEPGIDEGGILRECYELICAQIFNVSKEPDSKNYFNYSEVDNVCYQINPFVGPLDGEIIDFYHFAGQFLGRALLDNRPTSAHLAKPLYKYICGEVVTLKDLEFFDQQLHLQLSRMRKETNVQSWDLNFTIDEPDVNMPLLSNGSRPTRTVELCPNGKEILVDDKNKSEFIFKMARHVMLDRIQDPLTALLNGIYEVVPPFLLSVFSANDLEILMHGVDEISVKDWKNFTQYVSGYTSDSRVIIWFWEIVEQEFNNEQRQRLLQFVTGTSRVPTGGFAKLASSTGETRHFTISRAERTDFAPLYAHTCFNQLDIPNYKTKKELSDALRYNVCEGEQAGFNVV